MQRVGLLVPSANTVVEPEFWRMAPPGVSLHAARMRNSTCDVEDSIRMLDHVERAADELGSANVNVIAFACTASSFVQGTEGERDLEATIERASRATAVTTSGAVVAALKSLGARRLAMYTPYPAELNRREVTFLRSHGLDVVQERGLGIADAVAIADVRAAQLLEFVHDTPPPDEADTLFVSCTNLGSLESITALEREFDRPVISSNTATFWRVLQILDLNPSDQAPGRLFARPAVATAG